MAPPNRIINKMRHFNGPSVWLEFTALAKHFCSVNLGQGFPGFGPPSFVKDALISASSNDAHMQYAHPAGTPALRNEIARVYSPKLGFQVDPDKHVLVTVGASQALSLACNALVEEGDEVVLFEPAFDIYIGAALMAGATLKYVPMRVSVDEDSSPTNAAQLSVDMEKLSNTLGPRTRMVIINSPHNPTGKVFSKEELLSISALIDEKAPQCIVLSDEVYEHLVFEGVHIPFAAVSQSARDRTISIYSAGKTFSCTGHKIGWCVSSNIHAIRQLRIAQQYVVFSVSSLSQAAIAESLSIADKPYKGYATYYTWLCEDYRAKREYMIDILKQVGMQPIVPQGTFYVLAKIPDDSPLGASASRGFPSELKQLVDNGTVQIDPSTYNTPDYNMCRNLVISHGVTAIPPSAFFSEDHRKGNVLATSYARFAFCKPIEELDRARSALTSSIEDSK